MVKYHKNNSFNENLREDELLRNDSTKYVMSDEDFTEDDNDEDYNDEEYNEKIYTWLCGGVLIIWFFSMLYL